MEELTGKQKKHLRGLGQRLEVGASVGKGGLSPGLVQGISGLLERPELVKVRLPAGPPQGRYFSRRIPLFPYAHFASMINIWEFVNQLWSRFWAIRRDWAFSLAVMAFHSLR
jgi:hypothetical protein